MTMLETMKARIMSLLYKFLLFRWLKFKLGGGCYCPKCQGCGEIGCCPAKMCKQGFGCAEYYTPAELDGTETCDNTDDY